MQSVLANLYLTVLKAGLNLSQHYMRQRPGLRCLPADEIAAYESSSQEGGCLKGHDKQSLQAERLNPNYCSQNSGDSAYWSKVQALRVERQERQTAWKALAVVEKATSRRSRVRYSRRKKSKSASVFHTRYPPRSQIWPWHCLQALMLVAHCIM